MNPATPITAARVRHRPSQRRGAIIVKLAVSLPVIGGFAALGIDMSYLHHVHADMQRTADAAALAAAAQLARETAADPHAVAFDAVQQILERNPISGETLEIEADDVIVGRAQFNDDTGHVAWQGPTNSAPNAVEIRLRRTADSPSGSVPLYFARMVGKKSADVTATARAMLIPRDIELVVDLSGSMNDDSELRHCYTTDINLQQIWEALGSPTFGLMTDWGNPLSQNWTALTDPGLLYLRRNGQFLGAKVDSNLAGYNAAEVAALKSKLNDPDNIDPVTGQNLGMNNWINRVGAVLGLAEWHSGMAGARFPLNPAGDGDTLIENLEMVWSPYPFPSGSWRDWIGGYMYSDSTEMVVGGVAGRMRFGLKTYINYLLEARSRFDQTPVLYMTPEQPLQAVKDAVTEIVDMLAEIDSGDQLGLEVYATTATHEIDLTHDFKDVRDTLLKRQSNHYDDATCIGCGMKLGQEYLLTGNARPGASRVMVLLTDGIANFTPDSAIADPDAAKAYVEQLTQEAKDNGIQIHCVGVGADADMELLSAVADETGGTAFHAAGSVAEYSTQLREIFRTIGGKRLASLIR